MVLINFKVLFLHINVTFHSCFPEQWSWSEFVMLLYCCQLISLHRLYCFYWGFKQGSQLTAFL